MPALIPGVCCAGLGGGAVPDGRQGADAPHAAGLAGGAKLSGLGGHGRGRGLARLAKLPDLARLESLSCSKNRP